MISRLFSWTSNAQWKVFRSLTEPASPAVLWTPTYALVQQILFEIDSKMAALNGFKSIWLNGTFHELKNELHWIISKPTSESFRERLAWGARWLVRRRLAAVLSGKTRTNSENLIADARPDTSVPPIYMKTPILLNWFLIQISIVENSPSRM